MLAIFSVLKRSSLPVEVSGEIFALISMNAKKEKNSVKIIVC